MQTETDKEKMETDLLKIQEQMKMLDVQFTNAGKEKDNLQNEMEILLDRISKLTEMVEKTRVWKNTYKYIFSIAVFVILWAESCIQLNCDLCLKVNC